MSHHHVQRWYLVLWALAMVDDLHLAETPPAPPASATVVLVGFPDARLAAQLAQTLDARYRNDHLTEILSDLRDRCGLRAVFPPGIARSFTCSLAGRDTVASVLTAVAHAGGLTITAQGDTLALWQPADDERIARLTLAARAGTQTERLDALWELAQLGDQRLVPALLAASADADPAVAFWGLRLLANVPLGYQSLTPIPLDRLLVELHAAVERRSRQAILGILRVLAQARAPEPRAASAVMSLIAERRELFHGRPERWSPVITQAIATLGRSDDPRVAAFLISLLDDPEVEIERAAMAALGVLGDQQAAAPLLARAGEPTARCRHHATKALAALREARAVPLLLAQMQQDASPNARWKAAIQLGELHHPSAVEPLLALLSDQATPDELVAHAAKALERQHDDRAAAPLLALLTKPGQASLKEIIATLAQLRDDRAYEPFLRLVATGAPYYAHLACDGLRDLRDPRTVEHFLPALSSTDPAARASAARILGGQRHQPAADAIAALVDQPETFSGAVLGLVGLRDPRASAPLIAALGGEDDRELEAMLLGLGDPQTSTLVAARLEDADPDLRIRMAKLLVRLDHPRAIAALTTLADDASAKVRVALGDLMARVDDPRLVASFLTLLRDPVADVRHQTVRSLGEDSDLLLDEPLHGVLLAQLASPDLVQHRVALQVAVRLGDAARPQLRRLLDSPNAHVRVTAALALEQLGDAQGVEALAPLLRDPDPATRLRMVQAIATRLGRVSGAAAATLRDQLEVLGADQDLEVRRAAAWVLIEQPGARSLNALQVLLTVDASDVVTRRRTSEQLRDHHDDHLTTALHTLLGAEDAGVRAFAAELLGWIQDPRSHQPLCRLLGDAAVEVRVQAVGALAILVASDSGDAIVDLRADPAPRVRMAVADGLLGRADPRSVDILLDQLADAAPAVRTRAILHTTTLLSADGLPGLLDQRITIAPARLTALREHLQTHHEALTAALARVKAIPTR